MAYKNDTKLIFLLFFWPAGREKVVDMLSKAIESWGISLLPGKKLSKLGNSYWNENTFLEINRFIVLEELKIYNKNSPFTSESKNLEFKLHSNLF